MTDEEVIEERRFEIQVKVKRKKKKKGRVKKMGRQKKEIVIPQKF